MFLSRLLKNKSSLLIYNLFFFFYFIIIEKNIGFLDSSKSIISSHLQNNSLDEEYIIIGFIFQNFYNLLINIFQFFELNNILFRLDFLIIHLIFLISPILWLILLNIKIKKFQFYYYIIFTLLFLNPFYVDFLHFCWRQSMALAVFLIIWNLKIRKVTSIIGSIGTLMIHFGIFPSFLLMILFSYINTNKLKLYTILICITSAIIMFQFFPFSENLIPSFFPYRERLTLNFDSPSFLNANLNNMDGKFIYKYYFSGLIPIILIMFTLMSKKFYFFKETKNYNLILSLSLPLIIFNSLPTSNRLSYFFIFILLIYGPRIVLRFLKTYEHLEYNYIITFFILLSSHISVYLYFY